MSVLLGAVADDFTGATDLCNTLVRRGMRTVQLINVPSPGTEIAAAEAVVVALKSRTVPAAEAVDKSLAALAWLQRAGARQILFKYCSTFDSTDAGNIGPVAEALMERLRSRGLVERIDVEEVRQTTTFPTAGGSVSPTMKLRSAPVWRATKFGRDLLQYLRQVGEEGTGNAAPAAH